MLTHRGFSAWIVVDGKPLPEYLVAVDSKKNRVSCWIPSEEGKSFAVHWQDHGGQVDTCSFITLDGFVVPGRFLFGDGVASRQGVRTSLSTERPFVFQRADQVDNNLASEGFSKDVGMITLRIKRVARMQTHPPNSMLELPSSLLGNRKPGDHCIGFGQEARTNEQYPSTWSVVAYEKTERKNTQPSTYVSFVFRYRSCEFLEAQGIATEPEPELMRSSTPKRPHMRRVVSLPSSIPSPDMPAPPRKKAKIAMVSQLGPYARLVHDTRRTVSLKAEPKRVGFSGQSTIVLNKGHRQSPWMDSGDSSPGDGSSQESNL